MFASSLLLTNAIIAKSSKKKETQNDPIGALRGVRSSDSVAEVSLDGFENAVEFVLLHTFNVQTFNELRNCESRSVVGRWICGVWVTIPLSHFVDPKHLLK